MKQVIIKTRHSLLIILVLLLQLPNPHRRVPGTGHEPSPVGRKVERVDILVVPLEDGADGALFDVPDLEEAEMSVAGQGKGGRAG
jgi:hypothetical protein